MFASHWASVEALQRSERHYSHCLLCEHRCGANRLAGERGPCKADAVPRSFRHRIEFGEELELIPSHLFYLSGCDLRCVFCIAEENAFNPQAGAPLNESNFNAALKWGIDRGARNLQWVGGEPMIHAPAILRLMASADRLPPVVWKSDFHGTPEAFEMLAGAVDTYVADFKFGNDACARELAGVNDYMAIVTRNLLLAAKQADLIVRHLILPGHIECCVLPIVAWMAEYLPGAKFSIRDGYLPKWQARRIPQMNRSLSTAEAEQARSLARAAGLNVIQ